MSEKKPKKMSKPKNPNLPEYITVGTRLTRAELNEFISVYGNDNKSKVIRQLILEKLAINKLQQNESKL